MFRYTFSRSLRATSLSAFSQNFWRGLKSAQIHHTLALTTTLLLSIFWSQAIVAETDIPRLAPPLAEQSKIKSKSESAETLYHLSETTVDARTHWQQRSYISIRVNDSDAARDYGRIAIRFNHYYSELELEFANTVSADGTITALSKDALQTRVTGGGQDFYSDSSEIVFSLPDISPGSILEFQFLRKSKIIPLEGLYSDRLTPYWFQSTVSRDGWRADYVHNFSHELRVPEALTLHTRAFLSFPKALTKVTGAEDGAEKVSTWEMKHISGLKSESWQPLARFIMPTLYLSTSESWSDVDSWTWQNVADKLDDPSLDAVILKLNLAANADNETKVRAVYEYLQNNIRYVFAHLGRGGYIPHAPKEVIDVRYGDCKDQTVLAVALLRKLGVNAVPALIETPRAGNSDTQLVSLIFDHMIVHIPESEGTVTRWLDTTGDSSLYPGTSNYLADQNVLIINGVGGSLEKFTSQGRNAVFATINYYNDGETNSRAEVDIQLEGFMEQNFRSWWLHTTDRENSLNQYMASLFGNYESLEASVNDSENIWVPVNAQASFTFNSATPDDARSFGASITQMLRMFSNLTQLPLPELRETGFYDNFAYSMNLQVNVHGTDGFEPTLVQSMDEHQNKFFALEYDTATGNELFTLNMTFDQRALDINVDQYQQFYSAIQNVIKEDVWIVNLLPDPIEQRLNALNDHSDTQSADFFIKKARAFIETGQFTDAIEQAREAVDLKNNNGEAWYVLGMAQGFNSMIEESSDSFSKAEALGYVPK